MSNESLNRQDILDWSATQSRLLKAGVRNNDPVTVQTVIESVDERLGQGTGEKFFVHTVNRMIGEGFSFVPDEY